MTNQPPTRATQRITRRKELRQSRIIDAKRRRTNRTRLLIAIVVGVVLLGGLGIWFAVSAFIMPPPVGFLDVVTPFLESQVPDASALPIDLWFSGLMEISPWLAYWS